MSSSKREQQLESEIRKLQAEVLELRNNMNWPVTGETVRVPDPFKPLFDVAQETVRAYFSQYVTDPTKATIKISGQRYVLLRASSLSVDFLDTIIDGLSLVQILNLGPLVEQFVQFRIPRPLMEPVGS